MGVDGICPLDYCVAIDTNQSVHVHSIVGDDLSANVDSSIAGKKRNRRELSQRLLLCVLVFMLSDDS